MSKEKKVGKVDQKDDLPCWIKFLLNFLLGVILYYIFYYNLLPKISSFPFNCISPKVSAASLVIMLIVGFQLGLVSGPLKLGPITLNIFKLCIVDKLPQTKVLLLGSIIIVACLYVGVSPFSPFKINDMPPNLVSFKVTFPDGISFNYSVGATVDLDPNQTIRIEANIVNEDNIECNWEAQLGDTSTDWGCAVDYKSPDATTMDVVTVNVTSKCSAGSMSDKSLFININP